jgi:acyl-CoA synthetase (AMP-forming)/AMP-acid ligase II
MSIQRQVANKMHTVVTLASAGIIRPTRPDRLVALASALIRFGPTPAAGYTASALRYPEETAIIDEKGTLSFREVHERSNALAHALADEGVSPGDSIGIMCRNHRGFVETIVACSKLGAHVLLLNTAFSGPQLKDVAEREEPAALIFDEEFTEVLEEAGKDRKRFVAWHDPEVDARADATLEELVEHGDTSNLKAPDEPGKAIILTSGTTGTPKGASRSQPKSLDPAAALLSKIPLKAREKTMIAAPLFHAWGFANWTIGMSLSSTIVLKRKFDPAATLSLTAQHECTALVVVPVMLQRILDLPEEVLDEYDLSKVRCVPV